MQFLIIGIIFVIIILVIDKTIINKNNQTIEQPTISNQKNINLSKYTTKHYIMTQTELIFYRELKKVTDKLQLTIFTQVDLEKIIQVSDNNTTDRNRIKSRSVDFTIVNNKNCKIVSCIELDDYTHNTKKAKQIDNFKDNLFQKVNIPLHRIEANNTYNIEKLEIILQEDIKR